MVISMSYQICCRTFEGGNCASVNKALVSQMKKWELADNCQSGGEKCLYVVMSCLVCRRIKLKCNKQCLCMPVEELCVAYTFIILN